MPDTLILGVQTPKGGAGKTTIAMNLAQAIQQRGKDILVIDTDPQRSARNWRDRAPDGYDGPDVECITDPRTLKRTLGRLASPYDVAVIDGAARLEGMTGAVVAVSDVLLIPVQPSGVDLDSDAVRDFVELALEQQDARGVPVVAFVASRRIVGTNLENQLPEALSGYGVPILDGTAQRVAYVHSANDGRAVVDGYDDKATDEIQSLASTIL